MRIVYLTQTYPPMVNGVATVVEKLATQMARRGHQVLVITASEKERPYITQLENLTVMRLGSLRNPFRVGQRFLLYPRATMLRALVAFRPDLIHFHDMLQVSWICLRYARSSRIPSVLTAHQLPWFIAKSAPDISSVRQEIEALLWVYARWLKKQCTVLIAPTKTIARILKDETGMQAEVISSGVDLAIFRRAKASDEQIRLRAALGIPQSIPILLHVGRLDADKNVDQVIRAAAHAMMQSDAHLLVVGDGRRKAALLALCKSLGIENRSHFPGFVANGRGLAQLYQIASVFVTASEIETQGIVLLEAAASGLPIVAANATCIPEIVHDGINGYLTEAGDSIAMGRAISKILESALTAHSMGCQSRKLAEAHDRQRSFDQHELLYQRVLQDGRRRHRRSLPLRESWRRRIKARTDLVRQFWENWQGLG